MGNRTIVSNDLATPNLKADRNAFQIAHLAAIVESSDDAIVSKTLEGRILSWNRGATRIFGYEATEVIGQSIAIIIPPELHSQEIEILEKVKRGERIDHFDTMRIAKDGRRIPISLTVSPIRDPTGEIVGASKVARDNSERVRAEELLRAADKRKNEFMALLAHELRNLLAPIGYALAASKRANTNESRKRTEEIVARHFTHMTRLLEDLLDIARITQGKLQIRKAPTELSYIIGTAIETARPMVLSKKHTLSLDLPHPSVHLEADPVRLAQVFSNVLINAAKYTNPGGQIFLSATKEDRSVVITIRDNGIGIPADLMPRLFDFYAQGRDAVGRDEGGLGIGLSLVRGLVTLHGGTVEVYSEGPGLGSKFIIRLPIGNPTIDAFKDDATKEALQNTHLKVLVVDDNHDAAETCAALLEVLGHRVRIAYTGREALALSRTFQPNAILTDISLTDIDGYELAQTIRCSPWAGGVVLIAVTGWGMEEDRQRAFNSGFDHHLTKPVGVDAIESILNSVHAMARTTEGQCLGGPRRDSALKTSGSTDIDAPERVPR